MLLPVLASSIGIDRFNSRLSYSVFSFDNESVAQDTFGTTAGFNPFSPAISNGDYYLLGPNDIVNVPIAINAPEFAVTPAKGVMIVTQDNKNGAPEARLLPAKF